MRNHRTEKEKTWGNSLQKYHIEIFYGMGKYKTLSQLLKLHKEVLNPAKGGMKFLEIGKF